MYSILPCLLGPIFLANVFKVFFYGWGEALALLFLASLSTPPLLAFAYLLMPIKRSVECKKCGWSQDYKPLSDQAPTA